jgi:hypothetical protein
MLDAYIIDEIRKEEEARERAFHDRRLHIEIHRAPEYPPPELVYRAPTAEEDPRDPIVIPLIRDDLEEDAA